VRGYGGVQIVQTHPALPFLYRATTYHWHEHETAVGVPFRASNSDGVVNQSTSVLTATGDYWGEVQRPSGWSFGAGASVSSDVNFFPWETNSALTRHKGCTIARNDPAPPRTNQPQAAVCRPAGPWEDRHGAPQVT
jgi:hypothetical protein